MPLYIYHFVTGYNCQDELVNWWITTNNISIPQTQKALKNIKLRRLMPKLFHIS